MKNGTSEERDSMFLASSGREKTEQEERPLDGIKLNFWYGTRHTQMIFLFILIAIAYGMRVNMSVGIVAMTDPKINPDFPIYNWTIKSTILSSFFWGYVLPQIGAGQLSEIYGAKWVLFGAMGLSSLFTLLIPHMAKLGVGGIMACRVLQGVTQGFLYPSMHSHLSKWIPLSERARLGTFVYAGGPLGTVISMPVTGWISASSFGWPSVFYLYGILGILWSLIWFWRGASDLSTHKTISEEEVMYIQKSSSKSTPEKKNPTPWMHIVKSLPVWSVLIAHCGQAFGFTCLMTQIPRYMNYILHFDIKDNGVLSAAPYLALWLLSFFFSYITDYCINKKILSVGVARKIVTAIGSVGPGIALLALALADTTNRGLIIVLLITAVGIKSSALCGFHVNHIDIAPSHAGTLMGITNTSANIFSFLAPLVVEFIVTDETNTEQWKSVFFLTSAIYCGCSIMFSFFGKGEPQYWDNLATTLEEVALKEKDPNVKRCEVTEDTDKK